MTMQLQGKRALVTGSSQGIGEAIAKALARSGARVVVHGLTPDDAERVAQEILAEGGEVFHLAGDLGNDEGAAHVAAEVLAFAGGVDILINNVGIYANRSWTDATPAQWAELFEVNVLSIVRIVRLLMPEMKKSGWGRIINISSGEATQPFAFMPDYAATKAAIVNLSVSLSKELAGSGVTVNTVSPGIILTSGVREFFEHMALERGWGGEWKGIESHVLQEVLPNTVGRLGTPDDVAHLVAFLASPLSGYINGGNYRVDGGSTVSVN